MSELRCRPIIMSGPMVVAILAGTKSQTRRIVNPQPSSREDGSEGLYAHGNGWRYTDVDYPGEKIELCPYGVPGDTLWVREIWAVGASADRLTPAELHPGTWLRENGGLWFDADGTTPTHPISPRGRTRSPIHMPRWASRITLRITAIRAERLMDISEADAEAEGFRSHESQEAGPEVPLGAHYTIQRMGEYVSAAGAFLIYWDQLHGEGATLNNPLCWVISFSREMP